MIIKTKGEYKDFIRELSTEITARDSYKNSFEVWLEDNLYQGIIIDMAILDDGQRLHVQRDFRKKDFLGTKDNYISTYDIRLLEDGGLEMIQTTGGLSEKNDYNKRRLVKAPDDATSVFMSEVIRRRFDVDDIEVSRTDYYESDCPIYGINYDDDRALLELLKSPEHKPTLTDEKADFPTVANNSSLTHIERIEDNPAIAVCTKRYKRKIYDQDITNVYVGMVSTEWPETLRMEDEHRFAKREDGKWKTIEDSFYSSGTFEENIERVTNDWKQRIEYSMSKKYNSPQYELLKERVDKVNKEKTIEKIR